MVDYLKESDYKYNGQNISIQRIPCNNKLNDMDKGASYGRVSRTRMPLKEILEKEFIGNKDRGEKFYNKVLLEYGDDSVAELGNMNFFVSGISNLCSDELKKHRLASFLEVSTRYTDITEDFYVTPENLGELQNDYSEFMTLVYDSYNFVKNELIEIFKEEYPITNLEFFDKETKTMVNYNSLSNKGKESALKTWNITIEKKAIDEARYLLPAATKTNIGSFMNDRTIGYVIDCITNSRIKEGQQLGENLYEFFKPDIEPFIKRSAPQTAKLDEKSQHNYQNFKTNLFDIYKQDTSFIEGVKSSISEFIDGYISESLDENNEDFDPAKLKKAVFNMERSLKPFCEYSSFLDEKSTKSLICAGILQEYNTIKYNDFTKQSDKGFKLGDNFYPLNSTEILNFTDYLDYFNRDGRHTESQKEYIINEYVRGRKSRRHQPGRAFELADYVITISCSYSVLRELLRHRMMTVIREPLLTAPPITNNYIIPRNIQKYPHLFNIFNTVVIKSQELYEKLAKKGNYVTAQYVCLFALRTSVVIKINLRQLMYLLELRSASNVLDEFRTLAIDLHEKLKVIHPYLASLFKFMDKTEYYDLNRLNEEQKKEIKINSLSL